jgi:hypothetical protein
MIRRSARRAFVVVIALPACSFPALTRSTDDGGSNLDDSGSDADGGGMDMGMPVRGFQIQSAVVQVEPGEASSRCYYFRTPNTETMAIRKWTSSMSPVNTAVIMYTTPNDLMPPGTLQQGSCGLTGAETAWTYSAFTQQAVVELPADDGAGNPLAQVIPPNTAGFLMLRHENATENPVAAQVTITADALEATDAYTQTAAYVTYNSAISLPPQSGPTPLAKTCSTPTNAKFWSMSMHSHKQATKLEVRSGDTTSTDVVFTSTSFANPGSRTWLQAPYYTFANAGAPDRLTFECTYVNPTNRTVTSGESWDTDEVCMATGFMFPATAQVVCYCSGACVNL